MGVRDTPSTVGTRSLQFTKHPYRWNLSGTKCWQLLLILRTSTCTEGHGEGLHLTSIDTSLPLQAFAGFCRLPEELAPMFFVCVLTLPSQLWHSVTHGYNPLHSEVSLSLANTLSRGTVGGWSFVADSSRKQESPLRSVWKHLSYKAIWPLCLIHFQIFLL